MKKGFKEFVNKHSPDILCLNEVKCTQQESGAAFVGYHVYWNASTTKKGYAGTAYALLHSWPSNLSSRFARIFSKTKPISVTYGIKGKHNGEGRTITAEFDDFYLVNCYVPNSGQNLVR